MLEGVQDRFPRFLAAGSSSTAAMRADDEPNPLPFSGRSSPPPPPVFGSYPCHSQQWPPSAAHTNKHLQGGVVKPQGQGQPTTTTTTTGFLSTSLVLQRDRSMAPSHFVDSAWSHHELLALFRIRSAVENWFPEFTWEHVSRKLSEMGFKRSPQKCKEKFEEESRSYFEPTTAATASTTTISVANEVTASPTKINSYRLFSELEELYHHGHDPPSPPHHHHYHMLQKPAALIPDDDDAIRENQMTDPMLDKHTKQRELEQEQGALQGHPEIRQEERLLEETDVSEATHDDDQHQISIDDNKIDHGEVERTQFPIAKSERKKRRNLHQRHRFINSNKKFDIFKSFCEEIVNKMMSHQEELQNKILQDMIRRDKEKIVREEAWKKREVERINLEMEARAKHLALVAQRQAKIIEFLNKFSFTNDNDDNDNHNDNEAANFAHKNPSSSATHSSTNEESISQSSTPVPNTNKIRPIFRKPRPNKRPRGDNCSEDNDTGKRWPREEVLTLISIRCNVDLNTKTGLDDCEQNRSNSNKNTPLWERISEKMLELGYSRSAKKCKEKWENINKYFRKTKDMNKNRSVDSRTCPYFHQLNHLYNQGRGGAGGGSASSSLGDVAAAGGTMTVNVSHQAEVVVLLK